MQFKHPEILYALFLLLIPILVHLFQLRRFEKIPFTNVQFLKKIELQTRKSSKLKKLLILSTRLLLFTTLIIAFAQPFIGKITNTNKQHTSIYLDNSLSMQVKGDSGELLKKAIQDIIETFSTTSSIHLYTNDNKWMNLTSQELKNALLTLEYCPLEKDLESVLLDIHTDLKKQKNTMNNIFLISDFQNTLDSNDNIHIDSTKVYSVVQVQPAKKTNISLDSVYIAAKNDETISLKVITKSFNRTATKIPVSLYDDDILLGKSTIDILENSSAEVEFTIPFDKTINGRITTTDDNFNFDNELYFSINQVDKINVLAIGNVTSYLSKIYNSDEYNFKDITLNNLDYNSLIDQNLIVLNEIESIPNSLISGVSTAIKKGTHLVIIPHINSNLTSYNSLFKALNIGNINSKNDNEISITDIKFTHPFFTSVFEKSIKNFQYPKVNNYYNTNLRNSTAIVSFENENPFVAQIRKNNSTIYWLASAINNDNSNFKNSPLIVPVFYNFGKYSYTYSQLNYVIGNVNEIEIKASLQKDAILNISTNESSFIPMQQVGNTSVKITTDNLPTKAGIYAVKNKDKALKNIAYNYNRKESVPVYKDLKGVLNEKSNTNYYNSVKQAFTVNNSSYKTTNLWIFFLISSILFLVIELLLLKFFKP